MTTPNWQHHSKKERKRKLKPQALRAARERRRQLIKSLLKTSDPRRGSYNVYIHKELNGSSKTRNQISISKTSCY